MINKKCKHEGYFTTTQDLAYCLQCSALGVLVIQPQKSLLKEVQQFEFKPIKKENKNESTRRSNG